MSNFERKVSPAQPTAERPALEVRRLGLVPYVEALELQQTVVADRQAGRIPDVLLLLEHPHVITLGSGARHGTANVLVFPEELDRRGVELYEAHRGVT